MKVKFLDLYAQYSRIKDEIDGAIKTVIEHSSFIGGDILLKFENNFAKYQHAKHCIGVGNGTDALEIAIEALDLSPGSEIIVPANSFIASSEAITRAGHKVVFADINKTNYTLSVDDVIGKINPNTSAILVVHLYGHPCDMDRFLELASENGLKVIEDCAQAHGAEYKGKRVGSIGDIGAFSFYPGKNLGGYGDGGAILTNDELIARRCRMIANHGRIDKYDHILEGRNSRLDALQAAILDVKLRYLDDWIARRRNIANSYIHGLRNLDEIVLPHAEDTVGHSFHLFVIRTKYRNELQTYLSVNGIETGIHYPIALTKLKAYSYLNQSNSNMLANDFDTQLLSLPIGDHLADSDIEYTIDHIRKFFKLKKN